MTAFEILINGRKSAKSAIEKTGVMTVMISLVQKKEKYRGKDEIMIDVGGLVDDDSKGREDLRWLNRTLSVGDEVIIRIVNTTSYNAPKSRKRRDPDLELKRKRKYFDALKKELGETP